MIHFQFHWISFSHIRQTFTRSSQPWDRTASLTFPLFRTNVCHKVLFQSQRASSFLFTEWNWIRWLRFNVFLLALVVINLTTKFLVIILQISYFVFKWTYFFIFIVNYFKHILKAFIKGFAISFHFLNGAHVFCNVFFYFFCRIFDKRYYPGWTVSSSTCLLIFFEKIAP